MGGRSDHATTTTVNSVASRTHVATPSPNSGPADRLCVCFSISDNNVEVREKLRIGESQFVAWVPVNPQVRLHLIIGTDCPMLTAGDSDGVVPVASARHPGVQTETLLRAWHTEVHRHPETFQALLYILSVHHAEYQAIAGK